jgi:uncharacterized membrane protein
MSPITVIAAALVLGVLVGVTVVVGAPYLAIPIVLIAIGVLAAMQFRRRTERAHEMETFREQASTEKTDFTARDKETLA